MGTRASHHQGRYQGLLPRLPRCPMFHLSHPHYPPWLRPVLLLSLSFGTKDLKEGGYCQETCAGTVFFPSFPFVFSYFPLAFIPLCVYTRTLPLYLFIKHHPFVYPMPELNSRPPRMPPSFPFPLLGSAHVPATFLFSRLP